ncbi:MAG: diguanylate cyclase, partial [bacterium]|nr:diguanylate cyclase [bacterium]
DVARESAREISNMSAELLQQDIEQWLGKYVAVVQVAAAYIERHENDDVNILSYLTDIWKPNESFLSIYYGRANNSMVNASGWIPPAGFDLTKRPWYESAVINRSTIITEVFLNASRDHQIVTIATPIFDTGGAILGVIGADLSINEVRQLLAIFRHSKSGLSFIIDSNKLFVLGPDNVSNGRQSEFATFAAKIVGLGKGAALGRLDGEDVFLTFRPLQGTKWYVVTAVPTKQFTPVLTEITNNFLLAVLLAVLMIFLFGYIQYHEMLLPLLRLENAVATINVDKVDYRVISPTPNSYYTGLEKNISALLNKIKIYADNLRTSQDAQLKLNEDLIVTNNELASSLKKEASALARVSLKRTQWQALFSNSFDAIAHFDAEGNVVDINGSFRELFGYSLQEVIGRNLDDVIARDEHILEARQFTNMELSGQSIIAETIRYNYLGERIDVEHRGIPVVINGEVVGGYARYTDIRPRKKAEKTLLHTSEHDYLTGLKNRRRFELDCHIIDTPDQLPLTVIMADADGLKLVNDTFGHAVGDELLKLVASRLTAAIGDASAIYRIGGDEFVIVMRKTDETLGVKILSTVNAMCHAIAISGITIGVSFGIATKTFASESLTETIKLAEDRMYHHKLVANRSIRGSILVSLRKTLEERTHETEQHSERLLATCLAIGTKLRLSETKLDELRILSSLHDIGKIGIPDWILNKPTSLSDEEWVIMRKHPEIGYRIATSTPELATVADSILYHHERWDGTGYPLGLKGLDIPLTARILSVADSFDAMTSDRPYRLALSREKALAELTAHAGTQFDPNIIELFLEIIAD